MNFKKKLFMMSLAASMVVPSNLALVTNVTTPVFADEDEIEDSDTQLKARLVETPFPAATTDSSGTQIIELVDKATYNLENNVEITDQTSIVIPENATVTINLNGYNIESSASEVIKVYGGGTLNLKGSGKVKCTSNASNSAVIWINGVSQSWVTVRIEEVTLEASSTGLGIYQVGNSTSFLTNCDVKGRTGIEIQGGRLVVSGGTITGSYQELKVEKDAPYITYGAAIAVTLGPDKNVLLDIQETTLAGKAGLVLVAPEIAFGTSTNPGNLQLTNIKNISFDVNNTYDIGYDRSIEKKYIAGIDALDYKVNKLTFNSSSGILGATSIEEAKITLASDSYTYTGKEIKPKVTSVSLEEEPLTQDTDYIVSYSNNTKVGPSTVEITGIGSYEGKVTKTFEIVPASITDNSISFKTPGPYSLVEGKCEPAIEVQVNGTPLVLETDYTVEYSVGSTQDSGTVTVTGKGNYTGTATKTFTIKTEPATTPISYAQVNLEGPYPFTGEEITPSFTVTLGTNTLSEGIDYTVTYSNNTQVGEAIVTITGIGNFTSSIEVTFTINKASITEDNVTLASISEIYTGTAIKPTVSVILGNKTLTQDTDYEVSYSNNVGVGEAIVTVTGIGNYTGTVEKTFTISEAPKPSLDEATIALASDSYTFTGQAISPSVTVTVGTKTLVKGTDYEVTYSNNVQAGTAKATVTGKGDYTGTVEKTFEITKASINGATVTVNPNASTYTGTAIEPTVTVTLGDKTLTKGTDYTVSYKNNTALGQATVTVIGTGNYTGTATGSFTITEASIAQAEITGLSESYPYTGAAIEPTLTVNVNGTTLVKDTDYTLAYENNINLGTATITVTGIGTYTGTARATFEIEKPTIKSSNVTLAPGPYILDNGKCNPPVTVVVNDKTLVKGTDYNVFYISSGETGAATVSVVGKGNYKGTVVKRYTIQGKTFTSDDVRLAPGPYLISTDNFAPEVEVAGVSKDNYDLTYSLPTDEDGKVIAGEATVTVTGKGDYERCVKTKTYLILDDKDGTLDLSFTAGDDEIPVNLSIPLEDLPKENGVPVITEASISRAMTNGSKKARKVGPDQDPIAPAYVINVTGINSGDDLKPQTKITVKTNVDSALKFNFTGASKDPNPSISINFPINIPEDQSEISLLIDEPVIFEAAEEDRVIYEQLKNIDIDRDEIIEKEEMENYISKYPQYRDVYIPDDFIQDFREALQLGVDVYLDQDGFIEIEIPTKTTTDTDTKPSDSSSHKPTNPKPTPITPEEPMVPVVGKPTTMYRLYNRLTGEHLYTTDKAERDQLLTSDTWKDEGQGWVAPEVSDYPVYRLLNPNTGDHHYTTDKNEFDTLPSLGWVAEGIAFYSADKDDADNVILHRLYNPNGEGAGSHHYTTDENEKETLVKLGWNYEGTAWAGLKSE